MIDCHVHLAAVPDADNGCFISARMMKSLLFRFVAWRQGLPLDDPSTANRRYLDALVQELDAAEHVERAVLLAMDGVYDAKGKLQLDRTDFLVSNDYLFESVRSAPDRLLAGASINPARRDAIDELERCAEAGAVLVKVLPNTQAFDPADRAYRPFYRRLGELGLPLLSHVGYEFSLIGQDQSAGDPARLRPALDEGATVIAAHACSLGLPLREKYFDTFVQLVREYPSFLADASALTLPGRVRMLYLIRKHPELQERLLFGTDYPLPVFALHALGRAPLGELRRIRRRPSRFDRQYLLLKALGVGFRSFEPRGA